MKETPFLDGNDEVLNRFKAIPFLSSFGLEDLREIIRASKLRVYGLGERIIQEGDCDRWMYLLVSGEVSISKAGFTITHLSTFGSLFGELTALTNESRTASVTALNTTTCLAIELKIFDQQTETDKGRFYIMIYRLLAVNLSKRLLLANDEITRLRVEVDVLKGQLLMK